MGRRSGGPRWFESRKAWFAHINGKQVNLGEDQEEAMAKWLEIKRKARSDVAGDREPLGSLLRKYLQHTQSNRKPSTFKSYDQKLSLFAEAEGARLARDLRPCHVTEFIDRMKQPRGERGYRWGRQSARMMIAAIKSAYAWGVKQGYLSSNPIAALERVAPSSRDAGCVVTLEQHLLLASQVSENCADFLTMLWHTGSRPTALMLIEARDVHDRRAKMENRDGLKLPRIVIYLNSIAAEIVQRRCAKYSEGPIFRDDAGEPWTVKSLRTSMRKVKARCGCKHVTPYSYRHAYAHRALKLGKSFAEVAELLNTSPMYISKVYGHLGSATDHLQKLVEEI